MLFSLEHKEKLVFGDESDCVFWDFENKIWSSNGCQLVSEISNRINTVCECNHLTNFAALMNPKERNETLKSIFTYICCSISAFCLLFNLILLFIQNKTKSWTISNNLMRKRDKITFNLSVCLLIADLVIIFGMNKINIEPKVKIFFQTKTKFSFFESLIQWLCGLFSGLLLYSLLASFIWMLMEGIQLYQMIVDVFSSKLKISFCFAIGYGMPVLIIAIASIIIWLIENYILFDINSDDFYL